jgi:hypothetical protein
MKFFAAATLLATGIGAVVGAESLCDKYTTALLTTNNATNQLTLMTLVVNTALIGNYTKTPAPKNAVTGILAAGSINGTAVDLLKVSAYGDPSVVAL